MKEGKSPVRYLGIPLISKKLFASDCEVLLENISGIINSWLQNTFPLPVGCNFCLRCFIVFKSIGLTSSSYLRK